MPVAPPVLFARVRRHSPRSGVRAGQVMPIPDGTSQIGRAPDCALVLADPSVSRRHLAFHVTDERLELEPLVAHNGSFLDGDALPAGVRTVVRAFPAVVQVGGVVLEVDRLAETAPVHEPLEAITVTGAVRDAPILEVFRDAEECVVRCGGRRLELSASAARVLAALAANPGVPVHRWDLQEAAGGVANVAQLVSLVRRALRVVVDRDPGLRARLERRVRSGEGAVDAARVPDMDTMALLRHLVASRRGHGYLLCLEPRDVRTVEL